MEIFAQNTRYKCGQFGTGVPKPLGRRQRKEIDIAADREAGRIAVCEIGALLGIGIISSVDVDMDRRLVYAGHLDLVRVVRQGD